MTAVVHQQTLTELPIISSHGTGQLDEDLKLFYFPYLLRDFPWDRGFNAHYERAKEESNDWLHSLYPFTEKSQKIFNSWDFPYLAAVAYHGGSYC